jgi:hypothetical protein
LNDSAFPTIPLQINKTTARLFPAVLGVENPKFQQGLDGLCDLKAQLKEI